MHLYYIILQYIIYFIIYIFIIFNIFYNLYIYVYNKFFIYILKFFLLLVMTEKTSIVFLNIFLSKFTIRFVILGNFSFGITCDFKIPFIFRCSISHAYRISQGEHVNFSQSFVSSLCFYKIITFRTKFIDTATLRCNLEIFCIKCLCKLL